MTILDYITHRKSIFYPKTDEPVNHLRHKICKFGAMVYRYSNSSDQPDQSMYAEQVATEEAWKIGVPVLRIQTHHTPTQTYQVMKMAVGQTLAEVKTPHVRKAALANLGKVLAQVHSLPAFGYGFISPDQRGLQGVHATWDDYLFTKLSDHLDYLRTNELVTADQASYIVGAMHLFIDRKVSVAASLLHGDLNSHNIFVDDAGYITNLIDWEDCLAGDGIFDLASFATFTANSDEDVATLLRSYYTYSVKPKDFDLRFWTYYLRVSVSKLVLLHRYGYTDLTLGKARIERALKELGGIK